MSGPAADPAHPPGGAHPEDAERLGRGVALVADHRFGQAPAGLQSSFQAPAPAAARERVGFDKSALARITVAVENSHSAI